MSAHPDDAPGTPDTPDGPAPLADAGDLGPAREHAEDLAAFVTASPSSFHAAAETARRLRAAGFVEQHEDEAWDAAPGGHVMVRDGAVMVWWVPEDARAGGAARGAAGAAGAADAAEDLEVRIVGGHTDSPTFKLKPHPSYTTEGWAQAAVEVYGGMLSASWFDRELGLAGLLVTADGRRHLTRTGAVMRVPRLAVHLDRESGSKESHDRQQHTVPVLGTGVVDVLGLLAASVQSGDDEVRAVDVVGHDVVAYDTQAPQIFGAGGELLASGRLDNLSSVHAALTAFERLAAGERDGDRAAAGVRDGAPGGRVVRVLAAFDHEEVGSATRSGAAGPILADVLHRTLGALGLDEDARYRVLARSSCLSADAGHGVHPNHQGKHDPTHRPRLGAGPLLKVNAVQRYASDAVGAGIWERACRAAGVTSQPFVSRNDLPCGSTIGPITATRLGLTTVDVGVPLLSMHSARELAHVADLHALSRAVEAYLSGA